MASSKFEIGTRVKLNANNALPGYGEGTVFYVGRQTVKVMFDNGNAQECNKRTLVVVEN
jgi:hypothetical protein